MKVLYITNMYPTDSHPWYGIFVKEQIEALTHYHADIEADTVFIDGNEGKMNYLRSIPGIVSKIKHGDYDLVHIHYGLSGLFLLLPFLRTDVPVIMTLHGGDIQAEQGKSVQVALTKKILRHCTAAITLNDRMTAITRPHCSRVYQIPCSVNTELFAPDGKRHPLSRKERLTILFPSDRSRVVKNYPLFCETVELLRQKGLESDTIELSNMSRERLADTMRKADLLLMTSISEGSPQTVKEAMACNLPVVTTKVGDVAHLLEGVRDSGWTEEHNSRALADMVLKVLNGGVGGKEARQRLFELRLDDRQTADSIYEVYKLLLSR